MELRGGLDLPDALDLDAALAARAAALGRLGCEDSLDVRRSLALGDLARDHLGQQELPDPADPADDRDDTAGGGTSATSSARAPGRAVDLSVHLSAAAVATGGCWCGGTAGPNAGEDQRGRLEGAGVLGSVPVAAVRDWCGSAATITVRPVLDLAEAIHCESYEASDRLSTQTHQRDRTCTFPHCTRPATDCDDEHPVP